MLHNKFWQAFFALAPIIIGILSIVYYFYFVIDLVMDIEAAQAVGSDPSPTMILGNVVWFMAFIAFIILISLGSMIFYIVHAVQNPNLKGNNLLIVWILLFFFFSGIGQLIYWIVEIVGKRNELPANS